MTDRVHNVVLAGDGDAATELLAAGMHDFVVFDREVVSSVFDDGQDTWVLASDDGETCRGRIVVSCESLFVPQIPDVLDRSDFRGVAMHAAMPSDVFEPAGARVAVIGADSSAGELIERMPGAAVTVFPLAPRRTVRTSRRSTRASRRVQVIGAPIEAITPVGVRTVDGVHHDADAIVYGTGFAVRAGLPHDMWVGARGVSIQQTWVDGAEPYRGVAVHGFPNYFIAGGPNLTATMRYIVECWQLLGRHRRIEVRRSAQGVFNERVHLRKPSWQLDTSAFDVSSPPAVGDDGYEGPATLSTTGSSAAVRIALTGHVEPFDGQYHWQGTIFGLVAEDFRQARSITVTVGSHSAEARITERTPQGAHSIAGIGAPPFAVSALKPS